MVSAILLLVAGSAALQLPPAGLARQMGVQQRHCAARMCTDHKDDMVEEDIEDMEFDSSDFQVCTKVRVKGKVRVG